MGIPERVTPRDIEGSIERVASESWVMEYNGAICRFEKSSSEEGMIYELEVPEEIRNHGIGTSMLQVAETILEEECDVSIIYAQVGSPSGATKHVLTKHGFEITREESSETLGKILHAEKIT